MFPSLFGLFLGWPHEIFSNALCFLSYQKSEKLETFYAKTKKFTYYRIIWMVCIERCKEHIFLIGLFTKILGFDLRKEKKRFSTWFFFLVSIWIGLDKNLTWAYSLSFSQIILDHISLSLSLLGSSLSFLLKYNSNAFLFLVATYFLWGMRNQRGRTIE